MFLIRSNLSRDIMILVVEVHVYYIYYTILSFSVDITENINQATILSSSDIVT